MDNQECPVCLYICSAYTKFNSARSCSSAVSVSPRLLLMLCEQGNLGVHPLYLDDNEGPHVERFSATMWEIKTLACVGD